MMTDDGDDDGDVGDGAYPFKNKLLAMTLRIEIIASHIDEELSPTMTLAKSFWSKKKQVCARQTLETPQKCFDKDGHADNSHQKEKIQKFKTCDKQ